MAEVAGGRDRARAAGRVSAVAIALVLAVVVSGCTPQQQGQDRAAVATVTSTVAIAAQTIPPSTSAVVVPPLGGAPVAEESTPAAAPADGTPQATPGSVPPKSTGTPGPAPKPTPVPKPKPVPKPTVISTVPRDGAVDVDPLGKVTVLAAGGVLGRVAIVTPAGRVLAGTYNTSRTTWSRLPELGYGKTYRLQITARAADGTLTRTEHRFTTVRPKHLTSVTTFPADGGAVGVGQPVVIHFDRAFHSAQDRRAIEKQITVRSTPSQAGSFRWFSATELHWRPRNFWAAGARVTVDIDIYGKNLGADRTYGMEDRTFRFSVPRSLIAEINDNTHMMTITRNGRQIAKWPVSLGTDKYPTYNGTHIVMEKYKTKIMDSRTWGLTGTGAYRTNVKWATRISNSGEFVHAAPWSVYAQGNSNVSHGCVNVSEAHAKWFYDNFRPGDPVIIKNTSGPRLRINDGYGDWMIDWKRY